MNNVWTVIHFIISSIILYNFIENKKLQKSFEEIFGDGWHLEEEANLAQIMGQENDQQKKGGEGHSDHSMVNETDQNEEEENGDNDQQQKREIIGKFRAVKEKIRQRKCKEWSKFECTIAEKLGTNRSNIYKWIRELGMSQRKKQKNYTEAQKRKIVREFQIIKEQIRQKGRKYPREQWNKMDKLLAKKLGTNQRYVYKWIRELGMEIKKQTIPNDQRPKIVQEFQTKKEKIKQQRKGRKWSRKQWVKLENLLARKLGTHRSEIYKWIKEFGMGKKTTQRRSEMMRKYWEMKRKKMSDRKIEKALKVSRQSIRRWKGQFEGNELFRELEMDMKKQLIVANDRKRKIVGEFRTIKEQIKQKGWKYSAKQWDKIEKLLANKLGTNRDYVYRWIRELGMTAKKRLFFSNKQMRKIVRAFRAIKEEIKQQKWKLSRKDWNKIESLLAQKLGTNRCKIYEWIKEFGKNQRKMKSNDAKLAIVGKYWEMKRKDPKISDAKTLFLSTF